MNPLMQKSPIRPIHQDRMFNHDINVLQKSPNVRGF